MKANADEVANSIKEWLKDTIRKAPELAHDLGKFYFGVSVSTSGGLIAFEKVDTYSKISILFGIALLLQIIALILALFLVLPKRLNLSTEQELSDYYSLFIKRMVMISWVWFFLWFSGSIIGVYHALFMRVTAITTCN